MKGLLEFYETPETFTRYLFWEMREVGYPIFGRIIEPCVGSGAIVRAARVGTLAGDTAAAPADLAHLVHHWVTNDLDNRWPADYHLDATTDTLWKLPGLNADWTVDNPPFTEAIAIAGQALRNSRFGVALHLRASIHEVLKTGIRRSWMRDNPPSGIIWLPRFSYQRSRTTGKWTTDNVCACWCVWLHSRTNYEVPPPQFIRYAPGWVLDQLEDETPAYRERMDALMGYTGTEAQRQQQRKAA